MLRVDWNTTTFSKKYRKFGVADSVIKTIPYENLLDVVNEVQGFGHDMYPLMVTLTPVEVAKEEQLFISHFVVYASDEHYSASQHNWNIIKNALVLEKPVCCFCRMLEDMYLRHVKAHIDYVPGMEITKAREARKAVLGVKAPDVFCWDQTVLGNLPKLFDGYTAVCGKYDQGSPFMPAEEKPQKGFLKSSVVSPMEHEKRLVKTNHQSAEVRATSPLLKTRIAPVTPRSMVSDADSQVSPSPCWAVMSSDITERKLSEDRQRHVFDSEVTDPVETSVSEHLQQNTCPGDTVNTSDTSVETVDVIKHAQPSLKYLRELYGINPDLQCDHRLIDMIHSGYLYQTDAYPSGVIHPFAMLLLRNLSNVSEPLVIAKDWYMTTRNGGLPVVSVPEELEMKIRHLDSDHLSAVYLLAGIKQITSETVCELCSDPHPSDKCIRYLSYKARIEKMGVKCIGCGQDGCGVGNDHHDIGFVSSCLKCGSQLPGARFRHKNYLCDDLVRWVQKRQELVGLACLVEATWTWNQEDYSSIASYQDRVEGLIPFIKKNISRYDSL